MAEGCEWPTDVVESYRRNGYWTGERLDRIADAAAARTPEKLAVIDDHDQITYAELLQRVDRLAASFSRRGLADRDRVILQLPNRIELITAATALMRIGVVPVYCLGSSRRRELAAISHRALAVALIVDATSEDGDGAQLAADVVAEVDSLKDVITSEEIRSASTIPDPVPSGSSFQSRPTQQIAGPDDVAFLQLSGGTTGTPKLIPRTHDDYLYSVRRSNEVCGLVQDDVFLAVLPAVHNFPMSSPGFLGALMAGGTVVLTESQHPAQVFDLIARCGASIVPLVPPMAHVWANFADMDPAAASKFSSLRLLQVGGAKLVPELARRLVNLVPGAVQQVFGMAEGLVCYTDPDDDIDIIINTQGRPMSPADEIRIVDHHDQPVPEGDSGHLLARGPYTIRGYFNAPDANHRSFTDDGFYRTGDIARIRADGTLVVEGRSKDQIHRGGEKISAEEVEDILLAHPSVDDVVVVAEPDEFLGERSVAVIVAHNEPQHDESALRRASIAEYMRNRGVDAMKVPDRVDLTDSFPVTGVGKISRAQLRTLIREQRSTAK
ncbi:AMP-binding protein [Brevibacterium aurantiacum]|uniref:AMP-binding protein n=2 Tax=Brevibacterium aurantiacum TaxID=273384 RepID=A0A556CB34_BREAU|nr:AMP-binding protein [Brevibacterium aurantiacum]